MSRSESLQSAGWRYVGAPYLGAPAPGWPMGVPVAVSRRTHSGTPGLWVPRWAWELATRMLTRADRGSLVFIGGNMSMGRVLATLTAAHGGCRLEAVRVAWALDAPGVLARMEDYLEALR